MHRLWALLKFDLFPTYFRAVRQEFLDVLWGAALPSIAYLIWLLLGNPPTWVTATWLVWVLLIAGYYVWRTDHVRLMPKLEFGDVRVVHTPTTSNTGQPGPNRVVAQILVTSATTLKDCTGHLLRVWRWDEDRWRPTVVDEPLDLLWSTIDAPSRTLYSDIPQRLCIFRIDDLPVVYIHPWASPMQHRMIEMFQQANAHDMFKFDISVRATDGPAVNISVRVQVRDHWDDPLVEPC